MLRGFSLFGILVMNIQSFAMPTAAYFNPTAYGALSGLDGLAWGIGRLFFDLKFVSLFSLLFGASLVLAGGGARARRRLGWLVVFGLLHGYLLWFGDILFTYGVVGLVLLPAIPWSFPRQVGVGLGLLLVSSLIPALTGWALEALPDFLAASLSSIYDPASVVAELEAFRSGWLDQMAVRAELSFHNQVVGTLTDAGFRAAGFMLLGMAAVKSGLFEAPSPSGAVTEGKGDEPGARPWLAVTSSLGLALTGGGLALQVGSGFELRTWLFAQSLHELGSVGLALALGLLVVRLARRYPSARLTDAVARLGKVAFTAYIVQSVAGTFVFGGHGLGQYGRWGRAELLAGAAVFWLFQLVLAAAWTRRFRLGPLEAGWRYLQG